MSSQIPWNKGLKGIHLSPASEFKKGQKPSPKAIAATIINNRKRKGLPSPLRGTKRVKRIERQCLGCGTAMSLIPARIKDYCSRNCYFSFRAKNKKFLGTKTAYRVLHKYIERKLGQPKECEMCFAIIESNRFIHWANKSGLYLRDLSDWIRLCSKCHYQYDKL
jgi:hypothetical protein